MVVVVVGVAVGVAVGVGVVVVVVNDKQMAFAQRYSQRAPKSMCACGHSGDGANSEHADTVQKGHGKCLLCPCGKFSWARFYDLYEAELKKLGKGV